jgi:hypothetical protein
VNFPPGATATYDPNGNRLIVKNTEANHNFISSLVSTLGEGGGRPTRNVTVLGKEPLTWMAPQAGAAQQIEAEYTKRTAGFLPMKLDLPRVGNQFVFEGFYGAEDVEFHYEDWWGRARRLWWRFVIGAFAYLFIARSRPWWRTCWAILVLTFMPLVVSPTLTATCNALLAGWLTGLVLHRIAARLVYAPRREEAMA